MFRKMEQKYLKVVSLFGNGAKAGPIIICMHDVDNDKGYCSITIDRFSALVDEFEELEYEGGTLQQVLDALARDEPKKMFHFTFDDGCIGWDGLISKNYVSFAVSLDPKIYRSSFDAASFIERCPEEKLIDHLNSHDISIYADWELEKYQAEFDGFSWSGRKVIALPFGGEREISKCVPSMQAENCIFLTTITRARLEQLNLIPGQAEDLKFVPRVPFYTDDSASVLINRHSGFSNWIQRLKKWI